MFKKTDRHYLLSSSKIIIFFLLTYSLAAFPSSSLPIWKTNTKTYQIPPDLKDGFKIAPIESAGIKKQKIEKLIERIRDNEFGRTGAILLTKNDRLIYEGYFNNADRNDVYTIYSVSKPFTSSLIGIAIDRGFIKGVDQTVLSYFPEYSELIKDKGKENIRLNHLLTFTSGFDWDESSYSYEDSRNVHVQMEQTDNWIKFILLRPISDGPGKRWVYNTGNAQLLSAIIKQRTGLYLHEFAEKYLFGPLQIKDYYWNADPQGYTCAGGSDGGLRLKSRDLAKLAALYANEGKWNNREIVSKEWVKESTFPQFEIKKERAYGYLWHVWDIDFRGRKTRCFFHTGSGGDMLFVLPEFKTGAVVTSIWKNRLQFILAVAETVAN